VAFTLTTGDNFYAPDGVATQANYWRPERCLLALGIPWRAAWGNHDLGGTSTREVLGAPRYYAITKGPVRIVVLDGNDPANPVVTIQLCGNAKPFIEIQPSHIVRFNGHPAVGVLIKKEAEAAASAVTPNP